MLFHELVFKDFLVFKGENRIAFPPVTGESSLVVILAPNNGGKTNVIRALKFLLYGTTGEKEENTHRLINKAAVAEAGAPSELDSWVKATVEIGGKKLTIRRRIVARKYANGTVQTKDVLLEETVHERAGDQFRQDQGQVKRTLETLVPPELFDYFYFQGETLAEKLLKGHADHALREGLATLLHQDKWEQAANTVRLARQSVVKELQGLQEANQDYTSKQSALETTRAALEKRRAELETVREKQIAAERAYTECEEQIVGLSTGTSHQKLNEMLSRKRQEEKQTSAEINRLNNDLCKLVADSKGLPFFRAAFAPALKLLERMRKQNIIPADVSEPFIRRLLEANVCVCERGLDEEKNKHERSCVEAYLARTLAIELNSNLLGLLNSLDPKMKQNFPARIGATAQAIRDAFERRDAAIVRHADLESEIKDLEKQREKSNFEEIVRLQQRQRDAAEQQRQSAGAAKELESRITALQGQVKQLSSELAILERQGGSLKMLKLSASRKRAEELLELIDESLEFLKGSFHRILQTSVSRYYDEAVTDGSTARIDPESLLPSVERNRSHVTHLGGGQRQLLVLAHIISLAELRRELHEQLDSINIKTGKLDDQSFFLDSVFAPCDEEYARIIAEFLPGKARQMVLLLASQQWHSKIRKGIEPHVNKAFRFELHSPNATARGEEYEVTFRNKRVPLLTKIKPGTEAYTTIKEIN